jgi:hypothetical protein
MFQHTILRFPYKYLPLAALVLLPAGAKAQCSFTQTITQATSGETREFRDRFGSAVTSGDFDGDGRTDLAIGSPEEDWSGVTNAGLVIVHYGTGNGLGASAWSRWSQSSINGTSNDPDDLFGSRLASGYFNGDIYEDLVIGIPEEDQDGTIDSGRVAVKYGSAAGVTSGAASSSWSQASVAGNGNGDYDNFGDTLAVGDFNGDGHDDLAVGAPGDDIDGVSDAGRLAVFYGSPSGLSSGDTEAFNQANFGLTSEEGDHFASALAADDFNNDGYDDLAIGVKGEDRNGLDNVGWILIKFGDAVGLKASSSQARFGHAAIGAVDRDYDWLGSRMAAGDIDNDGYADLVVGIPNKDVNGIADTGLVGVLFGGPGSEIVSNGTNLMTDGLGEPSAPLVLFGSAVAVSDLNGDYHDDIIVGAPWWSNAQGAIAVFFGNEQGSLYDDTHWLTESCLGGNARDYQFFGVALSAGDYDGDGINELAAGDEYHTPNMLGAVFTAEISP